MNLGTVLQNLALYSLQVAALLGVGFLVPPLLRLQEPRLRLRYFGALLVAVLLLPFLGLLPPVPSLGREPAVSGVVWIDELVELGPARLAPWPGSEPLLWLLGLGAVARLLWIAAGARRLAATVKQASLLAPVPEHIGEMERSVGVRARFYVSAQTPAPLTFGWMRPTVLLPVVFPRLPYEAQRAIVCHELLHVRRRDWLQVLFQEGVRILLWFHPAIWVLLRKISLSREQVVDAEVVRLTGKRRAYLQALVRIAQTSRRVRLTPAPAFLCQSDLKKRVSLMYTEVSMSRPRLVLTLLAAAAVLLSTAGFLALALPLASPAPLYAQGDDSAEPIWITRDVKKPVKVWVEQPKYTEAAREARVQGRVVLQAVITEEGKVKSVKVVQTRFEAASELSPYDSQTGLGLAEAARGAIKKWAFEPATLDGEPVRVYYNLTVNFRLDKDKQAEEEAG